MRKSLTAIGAIGVVASMVALGPTAASEPQVQACDSVVITTGPYEGVGTTARKSSTSSCNDLNLVYADNASVGRYWEGYAGRYYRSSTGIWHTGTAGYLFIPDGVYPVDKYVLVSDLRDGTLFTVASWIDGGDTVFITH